jgi:small-conductance mechanosensitive channel
VYALGAVGVQITPLLGALGLGGLALAFVVQPALLNLFSGILLHFHRPLRVGEEIQTGDIEGEVHDVTSRSVVIQGHSGEMVFVPNSVVLEREVLNFTRARKRRSTLVVGVAYGTNIGRARSILEAAASGAEGVRQQPPVEVFASEFADSSINFEIDFWHGTDELVQRRTRDRVIEAVSDALAEAEITIPFPQRTLWMGDGAGVVADSAQVEDQSGLDLG